MVRLDEGPGCRPRMGAQSNASGAFPAHYKGMLPQDGHRIFGPEAAAHDDHRKRIMLGSLRLEQGIIY
eukprot:5001578-Pyramimonas_sp.AAC.1